MKEISLEEACRATITVGRGMSAEAETVKEVDLIAEVCANIVYALGHLEYIEIERKGTEWVQ